MALLAEQRYTLASTSRTRAAQSGSGAGDRIRTYDLRITNALLYQLSYTGIDYPFHSTSPLTVGYELYSPGE